ncbi:MAG: DUF2330 domain-containing protein [Thermoplasmatota archaeon]
MRRGPVYLWSCLAFALLLVMVGLPQGVKGDGCYIPVKPSDVFESGQNAIIGWDGEVERLYLSVNIYAEKDTTGFHVVPFPSMPEISLGSLSIFENHTRYLNGFNDDYYDHDSQPLGDNSEWKDEKVEILFQETIGEHDVTVIRVNDVENFKEELLAIVDEIGIDLSSWPEELNRIISNYTGSGYNYFTIDHYPIYRKEKTVDPLVYEFETDRLVFPLEISSMLEGESQVRLALFTEPGIPLDYSIFGDLPGAIVPSGQYLPGEFLSKIDIDLMRMFPEGANHNYIEFEVPLSRVRGDLIIPRNELVCWEIYTERYYEYENEDIFRIWDFGGSQIVISDLGISLFYNDRRMDQNSIWCMDLDDGSIIWEKELPCDEWSRSWVRSISTVDIDNDGSSDILVNYDDEVDRCQVTVRLDPSNGEDVPFDTGLLDFMPERTQVFRDVNGREYLALMSPYRMIVVDPDTFELMADLNMTGEHEKYGSGKIPMSGYIMHFWEGIGEGMYFSDGTWRWAWSPFHRLSAEELNRTGYIDDNIIWQFGFRYICELEHEGETYVLGTKWNSSGWDPLFLIDMERGRTLEQLSYGDLPEFEREWDTLVLDHDGDGEDEVLVIYWDEEDSGGYMHAACLNPISGIRFWDVRLIYDLLHYEGMFLKDLDADGNGELIVHAMNGVIVLDILAGEVLWRSPGSRLVHGNPDLDGDGKREVMIYRDGIQVHVVDPFDGTETLNFTSTVFERDPFFCGDMDGDGFEDLLYYPRDPYDYNYGFLSVIDGATGEEMHLSLGYRSYRQMQIFGSDGNPYIIIEDHSRRIGLHLDGELLDRLRENRAREKITILPAGPGSAVLDTGYEMPIVEISIAVVIAAVAICLYFLYTKRWKIRKMHL